MKSNKLARLCMKWLFPGLLLALVIGPQPWARPLYIGQLIVLLNDLAAMIIVFTRNPGRIWPPILICCILFAKALSLVSAGAGIAYTIFANLLIFLAAGLIAAELSRYVYRQVMILCVVSLAFMIMQAAGVGGLSQALSSQYFEFESLPDRQTTIFAPLNDLVYDVRVFRPPGLLRTGTVLSLVLLFALGFHFSQNRDRFRGGTAALCAMVVLSMSKTAFIGFGILFLYFLLNGPPRRRREVVKAIVLLLGFVFLYKFFFPGLFEHNLGKSTINYSLFVRINDLIDSLPPGNLLKNLVEPLLGGTFRSVHLSEGEHLSGIPSIFRYLPYLLPVLLVLTIIYLRWNKKLRRRVPSLASMGVPILLGLMIYPATFPVWDTGLYWFMMGFALLPIFLKYFPQYFNPASELSPVG